MEWAKAKARANRWEEEVILLDEEMRRVLEFCKWKASWWGEQINRREGLAEPLAEGLRAYAEEQADMERRICQSWSAKWSTTRMLAEPIIRAAWGEVPAVHMQEVTEGIESIIELDLAEEEDDNADDSDFEE